MFCRNAITISVGLDSGIPHRFTATHPERGKPH